MGRVRVRVQPRARRSELAGGREGALLVRVTAPPVEGRANAAVARLVARQVGVPTGRVSVVRGRGSRDKLLEVEGVTDGELARALGLER